MSRRTLLIILFVSLTVNVFTVGAVLGGLAIAAKIHRPEAAAMSPGPALWAAGESLPPQHRYEYRRLLREQGQLTSQQMRAVRAARREAWAHMGDEPFDPAATTRSLDEARTLEMNARRAAERRLVGFAAGLPPQERARFAEGLARWAPPDGPRAAHMRQMMSAPPSDEDRPQ